MHEQSPTQGLGFVSPSSGNEAQVLPDSFGGFELTFPLVYEAALIRKFGRRITPQDFASCALRLWGISQDVFGEVTATVHLNRIAFAEGRNSFDLNDLTPEALAELMKSSAAIDVDFQPPTQNSFEHDEYANLKWHRYKGSRLLVYAEANDRYATNPTAPNLVEELYTRMFPNGKAANRQYRVSIGTSAVLKEQGFIK